MDKICKPVIIDNVDVSKCDFFIDWYEVNETRFQDVPFEKMLVTDLPKYFIGIPPLYYLRKNLCDCYGSYCKDKPNCYFKRLDKLLKNKE